MSLISKKISSWIRHAEAEAAEPSAWDLPGALAQQSASWPQCGEIQSPFEIAVERARLPVVAPVQNVRSHHAMSELLLIRKHPTSTVSSFDALPGIWD